MENLFEKYIEGYMNVSNEIKNLDIEDRDRKIQDEKMQINLLELELKKLGGITRVQSSSSSEHIKRFEEQSKPIQEKITMTTEKIKEYEEEQLIVNENKNKVKELEKVLKNIKENAKNEKDNKIRELEADKPKIEDKMQRKINEIKKETEESVKQIKEELTQIEEIEKKDPHRARDEEYKEFLRNKIEKLHKDKDEEINKFTSEQNKGLQEIDANIKQIKSEYTDFLKNLGRIDRGEDIIGNNPIQPEKETKEEKADKKIEEKAEEQLEEQTNEQVDEQTNEQVNEQVNKQTNEQVNERTNNQINKKTEKNNIVLDISANKINVNGNEDLFYKEELKNRKNIISDYGIDGIFYNNKKAKKNIDYALISTLEMIDKSLVETYLKVIREGNTQSEEVRESIEKFNKVVDIEYKFNKEDGILVNWREKRIARNAKKLGIASLDGISEKSIFDKIKESFSRFKNINLLKGKEKQRALTSGENTITQGTLENGENTITQDPKELGIRKRVKVDNKNNIIEKNAQKNQQETQEQIGKEVSKIMQEESQEKNTIEIE